MPPIRGIVATTEGVTVSGSDGASYSFLASDIPPGIEAQALEDYLNGTVIPGMTQGRMQGVVHVRSVDPFLLDVYTADNDAIIPVDWWKPEDERA